MAPITQTVQHHHRPTTKKEHKPFKSRHATKGAIKNLSKGVLSFYSDPTCIYIYIFLIANISLQEKSRLASGVAAKPPTSSSCRSSSGGTRPVRSRC